MQSYVDRITKAISVSPRPLVLVSHSASGIWASQAAENVPDGIARLIYVCAIIPRNGESLMDWVPHAPESVTVQNMKLDEKAGTVALDDESARIALYDDCDPADAADALRRIQPSPVAPLSERVSLSKERFGSIPRRYIMCQRDRAIPLSTQHLVCETSPCEVVARLDTGHSPFYAAPMRLSAQLLELGQESPMPC